MLTPIRGAGADSLGSTLLSSNPRKQITPADSTTSFAQQLIDSLSSYLQQAPTGAHVEIDISPENSLDPDTRQFVVTVKNAGGSGPAVAITSAAKILGTIPTPALQTAPVALGTSTSEGASAEAFTDEADAYWGMQPKEVQILRSMRDQDERWEMGRKLAQSGFSIDTDIMLDFQDPYMTMKIRKEEGYTWIPALGQGGLMNRPGFSFPGMAPYDAFNPPRGSVHVSTDFANGLESTSPWSGIRRSQS